RLDFRATEVRSDEVDFGFDGRQVVLCASLENEPRPKLCEVRNARDVQEDVLRQNGRQTGEDLFRRPSLTLEVHDVGLHEHGAAVPEDRHRVRGERAVREFLDRNAEGFGGRLEKVPVPGRTLRVQLEVLDAPLVQDDQLDILSADVDDDVRILV